MPEHGDPGAAARLAVDVRGGTLAVARWGTGDTVVIAAHGITSSHRFWSLTAEQDVSGLTILAPDLRGRGDSADLPGPYGMVGHAEDLLAVADHVGADDVVVAGHSMGGFVAAVFAARHPSRTRAVVLVDGGPALGPQPDDQDVDAVLHAVIGPALDRLDRRFSTREEYRAFWHDHPALRDTGAARAHVDAYADHDLTGPAGNLRPKPDAAAVRADARDMLVGHTVRDTIAGITVPAVLVLAERGMLDDATPLYPDALIGDISTALGPLRTVCVPDTNHYTIGMSVQGARAIAEHMRAAASGAA